MRAGNTKARGRPLVGRPAWSLRAGSRLEKSQIPPAAKMQMRPRPSSVAMVTEQAVGSAAARGARAPESPFRRGWGPGGEAGPGCPGRRLTPKPLVQEKTPVLPPVSASLTHGGPGAQPASRLPAHPPHHLTRPRTRDSGGAPPPPRSCLDVPVLLPTGLRHSGGRERPHEQAGADWSARCPAVTRRQCTSVLRPLGGSRVSPPFPPLS